MEKLVLKNEYEIVGSLFGAANAAPNKGTTILYSLRSLSTVLTFQGLWVIFQYFSRQI